MKAKVIIFTLCLFLASTGLVYWLFIPGQETTARPADRYKNITDLSDAYNASAEIATALEKLKTQEKAAVISSVPGTGRQIALTLDGLSDRTTMQQLLDLLAKHQATATFFVEGSQTADDPEIVISIRKAGHSIENYSLSGLAKLENLPAERLTVDFVKAQKIISLATDRAPTLIKLNDTVYTAAVLQAVKAAGLTGAVKSNVYVDVRKIKSAPAADRFVSTLAAGRIVSIKLNPLAERITPEEGKTDDRPAVDKQPGLKKLPKFEESDQKDLLIAVDNLLAALKKAKYTTVTLNTSFALPGSVPAPAPKIKSELEKTSRLTDLLDRLIAAVLAPAVAHAAAAPPQEIHMVHTIEPAIAYMFGGLTNETAAQHVLQRLDKLAVKGTFFVTELEMKRYPQLIRQIIRNGHELGISIRPRDGETEETTRQTILRSAALLANQFDVKTTLVHQSSGAIADTTRQAAFNAGVRLIAQSFNAVQTKHKDYPTAEAVIAELFGKAVHSMNRGQIAYFRTDFYTNPRLTADLLELIKQRKIDNIAYAVSFDNPWSNPANDSAYRIKPIGAMLSNTAALYQYPVDPDKIPPRLRPDAPPVAAGRLMDEAMKRYVGSHEITYEDRMYAFSKMDERRLDKFGQIHTQEPVIFLTFDDWGTDAAINKLLYVLRKHRVSSDFFIITNNVLHNPNLLRAIAAEGHGIASHSDKHRVMSFRDPQTGRQTPALTQEELFQDSVTAYQKLADVTGDVAVDGKPSLTRFFRPPTLAISKPGFEKLFAAGHDYIVSGSISSYDYKAENVSELIQTIKNGIYTPDGKVRNGAIVVLHMSDTSVYTAMAIDILLTANAGKADSDPSKFKVGRLSDYLKEGYHQMERSKTLRLAQP